MTPRSPNLNLAGVGQEKALQKWSFIYRACTMEDAPTRFKLGVRGLRKDSLLNFGMVVYLSMTGPIKHDRLFTLGMRACSCASCMHLLLEKTFFTGVGNV